MIEPVWYYPPNFEIPSEFVEAVSRYTPGSSGQFAAMLLWQRGIQTVEQLVPFVDSTAYRPTSPFAFGDEMDWAIARLKGAYESSEKIAIWGDFDADGVTATSVLWEGLGHYFPQGDRLSYVIPNRLINSHGLNIRELEKLAEQGVTLIVTCDTGSTNSAELDYARSLEMDVIVTDHHTLPPQRPNVVAIINPRSLPTNHPLAHLSGVAVAYKLVEALYETLPNVPQKPLEQLLDLVAIGLIADLVELKGDCRYLAQVGIQQLQTQTKTPTRPGVAALLTLCRRMGDRPTDISFGIGPRINAISRIYGDAHFCVELLTSTDRERCQKLAEDTELANSRRRSLQRDVVNQVIVRLAELDLSTTGVIVLADAQWPIGVLGLVAGQIAQEYNRPTILLTIPDDTPFGSTPQRSLIATGSARSINQIDLYDLVNSQSHLLLSFGGHPYAAGLSLQENDIQMFSDAINQEFRSRYGAEIASTYSIQAHLLVRVVDLGKELFRELRLLEPYGMGNPVPRLLIQNCWFNQVRNRKIQDLRNHKLNYIKTSFELWDDSVEQGFPGTWWGHYLDDIPAGRCDAIVELDYSTPKDKRPHYEIRLIEVRPTQVASPYQEQVYRLQPNRSPSPQILDWRMRKSDDHSNAVPADFVNLSSAPVTADDCPANWEQLRDRLAQAKHANVPLAIAFPPPSTQTPEELWQRLVGIAKYLSRTEKVTSFDELKNLLGIGEQSLQLGLSALNSVGFKLTMSGQQIQIIRDKDASIMPENSPQSNQRMEMIQLFIHTVGEEQFHQQFFHAIPAATLQRMITELA